MKERQIRYLAERCHHAKHDRCRCRCAGKLHGVDHGTQWIQQCVDADWNRGEQVRTRTARLFGQLELFGKRRAKA